MQNQCSIDGAYNGAAYEGTTDRYVAETTARAAGRPEIPGRIGIPMWVATYLARAPPQKRPYFEVDQFNSPTTKHK